MKVSRSSYYDWLHSSEQLRVKEDKAFIEKIKLIFQASRRNYGSRRVRKKLLQEGCVTTTIISHVLPH